MVGFSNIADISAKLLQFWGGNQATGNALIAQGLGRTPTFGAPSLGVIGQGVGVSGSNATLASGVATAASFSTVVFDDLGFFNAGDPTLITIPEDSGITRISLSATVQWGQNSTGRRAIFTEKNGSSGAFGSVRFTIAPNDDGVDVTVVTGSRIIDVDDEDEFELFILQTSGVSLVSFFQLSLIALG